MVGFAAVPSPVPAPSSSAPRLKLWHMLPIAAGLHGLLFWIPVQTASNAPVEKPKEIPPSVKVSTLPSPVVTPSPSASPKPPVTKTQPPVAMQPIVPAAQPPRQIIEERIIERIVEKPVPQEKPAPVEKPTQQEPIKPKPEPEKPTEPKPVEPVKPTLKFDTATDVLTNDLGGQSCGIGCIETASVSIDVITQLTQRFGKPPQEIRDINTDSLLGYTVINAKGEQEHIYRIQRTRQIAGRSVEISIYQNHPSLITDQNTLIQMGIS